MIHCTKDKRKAHTITFREDCRRERERESSITTYLWKTTIEIIGGFITF
jgi:transcription initiation factor IIE alpha subunit